MILFMLQELLLKNLLAYGMLPESRLIDQEKCKKTLVRAAQNWNWSGGSWSWNYPTLAMNATRLLQPEIALRAITMDNRRTCFYLVVIIIVRLRLRSLICLVMEGCY